MAAISKAETTSRTRRHVGEHVPEEDAERGTLPSPTADSTNGAARSRSVSPRAIRAKSGKSAIPKTSTTFRRLGPSTPTMATTKRR